MALGRTRRPAMVAIGIRELPELQETLAQRQQEQNRRQRADLMNRRFAFRMVNNILKKHSAAKAFEDAIKNEKNVWEEEEEERIPAH